jgi:hypothetical protein
MFSVDQLMGPAYSSVVFAINTLQYPGRVGPPQTNHFSLIKSDLRDFHIFLNSLSYLLHLRNIALNKVLGRRLQFNED